MFFNNEFNFFDEPIDWFADELDFNFSRKKDNPNRLINANEDINIVYGYNIRFASDWIEVGGQGDGYFVFEGDRVVNIEFFLEGVGEFGIIDVYNNYDTIAYFSNAVGTNNGCFLKTDDNVTALFDIIDGVVELEDCDIANRVWSVSFSGNNTHIAIVNGVTSPNNVFDVAGVRINRYFTFNCKNNIKEVAYFEEKVLNSNSYIAYKEAKHDISVGFLSYLHNEYNTKETIKDYENNPNFVFERIGIKQVLPKRFTLGGFDE